MVGVSERRSGYQTSIGGMIGALIAAFAVIAFVWGLTRFQHRDVEDPVETVEYTQQLEAARGQAPFDVLAPSPVPEGWRVTSVDYTTAGPVVSWHLGLLTGSSDDSEYVGLEQSNGQTSTFVEQSTRADQPAAPVTIDGVQWEQLTKDDEIALVLTGKDDTVVVTGTASLEDLTEFAESLSTD
jgi:hypothetical protein